MRRRNFLLGVSGSTLAGSALVGASAFSRIESGRSIEIGVAEDPDAYLGLDACDAPNGSFANLDESGHLELLMSEENPEVDETGLGRGVNTDSSTRFDRVFRICNQGTEGACVWIADDENWPEVEEGEHAGERRVEFYLEADETRSLVGEENAVPLEVGECVCVGVQALTYGLEAGDTLLGGLGDRITVNADVDGACRDVGCPVLDAEYECTLFDSGGERWPIIGHEVRITNRGDATAAYSWATIGEDQDDYWPFDTPLAVEPGETRTTRTDTDYPVRGLVWWTGECTTGTVGEFGDFFDEHAHLDLDDVDDAADAALIGGFPSVADLEESESEGRPVGDVVDCDG